MEWVPTPNPSRTGGESEYSSGENYREEAYNLPSRSGGVGGGSQVGGGFDGFEGFSYLNKPEAELTLQTLQQYFERIGKTRILNERLDVGVISPYRAQVQYLRSQLKKKEWLKPFRHLITVNTVDGFQGQERDIIVISLVRSNDEGQIGFLRDLRRMNVAITRARMKLIIIGDVQTMTRHPFYRKLYEYIEALVS
jgi:superfamily I DNA and/or RNA helicase